MNYYSARQTSNGGWRWTCMNDGLAWASGGCTEECQHATPEAAERHHYEHRVSTLREQTWEYQKRQCQIPDCPEWTQRGLGPAHEICGVTALCDGHRNAASWRFVNPFKPGRSVMSSY